MDVTEILVASRSDDERMAELLPLIYDKLRELARYQLRRERPDHTLNTTALVHEAYIKLIDTSRSSWANKAHFYGAASRAMRQVLVDYARHRTRQKRGGGAPHVSLDDAGVLPATSKSEELIALDEALRSLEALDPRQSRVVECRYFGGMSIEETAEALDMSASTVKREWRIARMWLYDQLQPPPDPK